MICEFLHYYANDVLRADECLLHDPQLPNAPSTRTREVTWATTAKGTLIRWNGTLTDNTARAGGGTDAVAGGGEREISHGA